MSTSLTLIPRFRRRVIAAAVAVVLTAGAIAAFAPADGASATSYPSWDDVQAAKASAVGAAGQGDGDQGPDRRPHEPGRRQAEVRRGRRHGVPDGADEVRRRDAAAAEAPAAGRRVREDRRPVRGPGRTARGAARASECERRHDRPPDAPHRLQGLPVRARRDVEAQRAGRRHLLAGDAGPRHGTGRVGQGRRREEGPRGPGRRRPAEDAGRPVRRRRCSDGRRRPERQPVAARGAAHTPDVERHRTSRPSTTRASRSRRPARPRSPSSAPTRPERRQRLLRRQRGTRPRRAAAGPAAPGPADPAAVPRPRPAGSARAPATRRAPTATASTRTPARTHCTPASTWHRAATRRSTPRTRAP